MMPAKIRAAVLHKTRDLRIDQVPMPRLKNARDILVKIKMVGVCGSDVHYYRHGRIGDFIVKKPLILGHECSGEVVEVGKEVVGLKLGDRVALEPGVPCGRCKVCRTGRYNLCKGVVFLATPPVDGAFVEYLVHPYEFAYKLPDSMSLEEGAMIEPLAVGMHAARMGGVTAGQTVAVFGSGPIGLVTLQAALASGAARAVATDVEEFRLKLAKKLGANLAVNSKKTDPVAAIMEFTDGGGVDVAFECVGIEQTALQCVDAVGPGGTVVLIGMGATSVALNPIKLMVKEVVIKSIFRYANVYSQAIQLVAAGKINLKAMITGRYPLDEVETALNLSEKEPASTIKTMVSVG